MDTDILPMIIEDFPLEVFTSNMSDIERKAFYQGFSKCFVTMIKAIKCERGVYILPTNSDVLFGKVSEAMISEIKNLSTVEL